MSMLLPGSHLFFFFNDTATTEIYTLSLHDALPIYVAIRRVSPARTCGSMPGGAYLPPKNVDRKSTRLNSSHSQISYAVFCLKKKKLDPGQHRRHPQEAGHLWTESARHGSSLAPDDT